MTATCPTCGGRARIVEAQTDPPSVEGDGTILNFPVHIRLEPCSNQLITISIVKTDPAEPIVG